MGEKTAKGLRKGSARKGSAKEGQRQGRCQGQRKQGAGRLYVFSFSRSLPNFWPRIVPIKRTFGAAGARLAAGTF